MLLALAVDRSADEPRSEIPHPGLPAAPIEERALGGDQLALVAALAQGVLVGADDAHVGIAGALAAALLTDLEERVDPALVGRVAGATHGDER